MQKTVVAKKADIKREWYIIDAKDVVLGRLATEVAALLTGKNKTLNSKNLDMGDHVVIINAGKIAVTGNKLNDKMYYRHSGFPGGFKETDMARMMTTKPTFALQNAIKGMLPKNKLQKLRMARLYLFADEKHDKAAQLPKEYKINKK